MITPESDPSRQFNAQVPCTILLVDDQLLVAESVRRLLANEQEMHLHYCSDPERAMERAEALLPTVILLDLLMPGKDGLTLLTELRQHPHLREIPVVMLSVNEDPEVKADAFAHGADDYLVKLPARMELIARLRYHSSVCQIRRQRDLSHHALQESESRFRLMADYSPMMIWMSDTEKSCNYFNKVWLEFRGRSLERELGNGWAEGVHADDLIRCLTIYQTAFDARQPFAMEYRLQRYDGEYRWIYDAGAPRIDEAGRFAGYIGSCLDVTERKQMEEELRLHRDQLDHLVRERTVALERLSRTYKVLSACNEAMFRAESEDDLLGAICRLLVKSGGYRLAWVGYALADEEKNIIPMAQFGDDKGYVAMVRLSWGDSSRGRGPSGEAIRCGRPVVIRDIAKDPRFTLWRMQALERGFQAVIAIPLIAEVETFGTLNIYADDIRAFDDDEIDLLVGLGNNLSFGIAALRAGVERHQAEEALRASEQRFQTLARESPVGIFEADIEGRCTFLNPRWASISGVGLTGSPEEGWLRSLHPEDREWVMREWRRTVRERKPTNLEFRFLRPDGTVVWVVGQAAPALDEDGRTQGFVGSVTEITELKRLEKQLRQVQKLEAIGTLAGGIAHDFNNLLGAIIGYSELVMDELPSGGRSWQNVQHVLQAGMRARDLVSQLLAFSRQTEQERRILHPGPIVREVVKFLRASIPTTIEIRAEIDPTPGTVLADPTQIHQILLNLGTNAAQAMKEKGNLLEIFLHGIRLQREEAISLDLEPGSYVEIGVRDNGGGIKPEVKERIFDPFFTTKEVGEGTGLGLSVVHGIVSRYEGAVTVDSLPGEGAYFRVLLPCHGREDEEISLFGPSPPPPGKGRILLVDDETVLVILGKQQLEKLGYQVVGFADAEQAWSRFHENPEQFDAVITDLIMPKLTGSELAGRIHELRPGLPIILCTGVGQIKRAEQVKDWGFFSLVTKPFLAKELAQVLRDALADHHDRSEGVTGNM